jgi:hypothetical protein
MAVVVEPQRLAGAFFIWYNISRKVPVTLRGLVRFFIFLCYNSIGFENSLHR